MTTVRAPSHVNPSAAPSLPASVGVSTPVAEVSLADLEKFLSQQGMRVTAPRRKLLQVILRFKENFSSEELCRAVQKSSRNIGRATVYRTLKVLVDGGVLKSVDHGRGKISYLLRFSRKTTLAELLCINCGRVEVIEAPFMEWYAQSAAQKCGLQAVEGRLQVQGECLRLKEGRCPHLKVKRSA
jgi:Fur family ferric uptake transcriptional regulator